MAESSALNFSETGILGTAAEIVGSVTRMGLRFALAPMMALKDMPFGIAKDTVESSASFPRAVSKAFEAFAAELKNRPYRAQVSVAVVSTEGNKSRLDHMRELGVVDTLRKPFEPEELKRLIDKALGVSS